MRCYIGIGSNLGDRQKNIEDAIEMLRNSDDIKVNKVSRIYETEPLGGPVQPKYLNGVIEIDTDMTPKELFSATQRIEELLGRERLVEDGPRTIDLDILTFGSERIDEPDLKIPHPRMNEREFVLRPLKELKDGNI
ncbi:MAG: 2-amino-4-hydroxy-6-hydroxymethyldihydropteridine diphosphokinase [Candidatus Omnitrophica bacterium]|nr:2-amino-4-hydroxy-6-hydroxymethyldihydropteridine diphosphokinase [Candidatus Omnitrophota bacterium]